MADTPRWSPGPELVERTNVGRFLIRHGLPLAGAGLLAVAILNVDYLIVGSVLGAAPLGLYVLAYNMASICYLTGLESIAVHKYWLCLVPAAGDPVLLTQDFEKRRSGVGKGHRAAVCHPKRASIG